MLYNVIFITKSLEKYFSILYLKRRRRKEKKERKNMTFNFKNLTI